MRVFSKISPAIWQSERFRSLPSQDGRFLFFYFLTSGHQTSAGCHQIPDGYACTDLDWTSERYKAARQELIDAEMIRFDPDCKVVMVTNWFKHNPPMNPKHAMGIEKALDSLPSEEIREAALEAFRDSQDSPKQPKGDDTSQPQKRTSESVCDAERHVTNLMNTSYMRSNGRAGGAAR